MKEKRSTPLTLDEVMALIETGGGAHLVTDVDPKVRPIKPTGIVRKNDRLIVYHDISAWSELHDVFGHRSDAARNAALRLRSKAQFIIAEAAMWESRAEEWEEDGE